MVEQSIVNGLAAGLSYALLALGFGLIVETCGFFDLGQGAIYVVGFYLTYLAVHTMGLPLAVGILGGIAGASVLGLIIYRAIYAKLRIQGAGTVVLLIASMAVMTLIENAASLVWGPGTQTVRSQMSPLSLNIYGSRVSRIQIISAVATILVYCVVGCIRHSSSWGRKARAVGDDSELAAIAGIKINRVIASIVIVGSAITALAGILSSLDTDMSPTSGFSAVLVAWVVTVLGGKGRIANIFVAGIVLGLAQHIATIWWSSSWQNAILYGSVFLVLLWRPRGLASIRTNVIQQ